MKGELSPLERSRQILRALAEEERERTREQALRPGSLSSPDFPETGNIPQKPVKRLAAAVSEELPEVVHPLLRMDSQELVQGVILSEILGKPLARRRGRWSI